MPALPTPDHVQLRFIAALAHAVTDAVVTFNWLGGRQTVVSYHPMADLDPCRLRALVADEVPARSWLQRVASVSVAGGLDPLGGGVVRRAEDGTTQYWFATTLDPAVVGQVLERGDFPVPSDAVEAWLRGDGLLGVTVVRLEVRPPSLRHLGLAVARVAQAQCAVEELTAAPTAPAPRDSRR